MSEFYKNSLAKSLKKRIDRDYIFSMHKISSEKKLPIGYTDIQNLDNVLDVGKTARPEALKQVFVELTSKAI